MTRGKDLSKDGKSILLACRDEKLAVREIAQKMGRSYKVISNFLNDSTNYGKNKKGGPRKKLSLNG